jgi:hypothetical protein
MKLNAIQVAGLRALAAAYRERPACFEPNAAYTLGAIEGKAELARELLQEAAHASGNGRIEAEVCTAKETPGACRCASCTDSRNFIDQATR